jgi:hypothetical protein
MLAIVGMALIMVGLWEELSLYMMTLQEDESVIYYAVLTFLKFIGSFLVLVYTIVYLY